MSKWSGWSALVMASFSAVPVSLGASSLARDGRPDPRAPVEREVSVDTPLDITGDGIRESEVIGAGTVHWTNGIS